MGSTGGEGSDGYVQANATLRALYEERMLRAEARHWDNPDVFELGPDVPPLRLCSLPGRHLGSHVWISGKILARFLASGRCAALPLQRSPSGPGVRCLELGAGVGVAGLAAVAAGGAASLVLTDKEELLPLLRHNIQLNGLTECCTAETLVWGSSPPSDWGSFDVVFAADVIYPTKDSSALLALRETIFSLCPCGSSTILILAYQERAEEDRAFLHNELLPHFDVTMEEVSDVELFDVRQPNPIDGSADPGPRGGGARADAPPQTCQVYSCRRLPR